jgi:hypothetical protein
MPILCSTYQPGPAKRSGHFARQCSTAHSHHRRDQLDSLQRHYNVHRIFLAKSTARLRHPQVDATRQEAERVAARAGASEFPSDLGAGLAARSDRDPGWSPWPTPCIQTQMIASIAPRATSPAR